MESDTYTSYEDNSQSRPVKRRARMALSCQRQVKNLKNISDIILTFVF